jgi:RND family efflux transporter MFP subunit
MAGILRRAAAIATVFAMAGILAAATPHHAAAQQGGGQRESGASKSDGDAAKSGDGEQKQQRRRGRGRRGPPLVQVDPVKVVPVTQTVPVLGRLVARQTSTIAARAAGPIETLHVQVGDRVKKGDVIATLVSDVIRWRRELRASEVAEYQASIESSKAQLAKAENEMRRMRDLRKSAAFSKARYEDQLRVVETARGELNKSLAELRQSKANLQLAEIDLYNAKVRAPYAGVVTQRHTFDGAYVSVGGPVVTLLNDAELEIEADVPANRLAGLKPGKVIEAEIDQKAINAAVRAVVPDENPLARTRAVRFTPSAALTNIDAAANQSVLLRVPVGQARDALSVHKDAVLQRGGGAAVFVIADGRAQMKRVKLGEAVASRFEVLEGLADGDQAVIRGNERLRDNQRVRLKGEGGGRGEGGKRRKREADE